MNNKEVGIYIHIPFCKSKCGYCDFISFSNKDYKFEPYKDALIKEINNFEQLKKYKIKTIFMGGGTPTVLPSYFIKEILEAVYKYDVCKNVEITIESNPGTLTLKLLRDLKEVGVNRISMGLQAWQNKYLERIERSHKLEDFLENYNNATKIGFKNINIDLIFSLPDSQFNDWVYTLKSVVELSPTHISVYSLALEEGTSFYKQYEDNNLELPSEEEDRKMYHFARSYLKQKGYYQYEISNFAKLNFESKHNSLYWKRENYKGFGLGAHSFLEGVRSNNITCLDKYIKSSASQSDIIENIHTLTTKESMEEFMFLGLRLNKGIDKLKFKEEFNVNIEEIFGNVIQKNIEKKLVINKKNIICLTEKGIDISNYVMSEFLLQN